MDGKNLRHILVPEEKWDDPLKARSVHRRDLQCTTVKILHTKYIPGIELDIAQIKKKKRHAPLRLEGWLFMFDVDM